MGWGLNAQTHLTQILWVLWMGLGLKDYDPLKLQDNLLTSILILLKTLIPAYFYRWKIFWVKASK